MKKSLNLSSLKVKSFVTSMEEKREQTVKGGTSGIQIPGRSFPQCAWTGPLDCPTIYHGEQLL